jgi:hypothetical protein
MDILATLLILILAAGSGAAFKVDTTAGILGFSFAGIFAIAQLNHAKGVKPNERQKNHHV